MAAAPAIDRPSFGGDGFPPLHVPLRFFVTAAAFAALAGLLWIAEGDTGFATRWSPTLLGATHLLALGFFTMVMVGALFQVIPVLSGAGVPRAVLVADLVHPGLTLGTLCLAAGLWRGQRSWLLAAVLLLGVTFVVFAAAVGRRLLGCRAPALRPLRWALLAFLGTIALGFAMAVARIDPSSGFAFRTWTNVHATWGGAGFAFLLVVGVSHQVVPMFHVTPPFPPLVVRAVAPVLGCGLALLALPWPLAGSTGVATIAAAVLVHVLATLRVLARRRRRRADATVAAWQLGLPAVAVATLLGAAVALPPRPWLPTELAARLELASVLLFALGGLGTIVIGMLPKVVSFLAFLHLQRRCLSSRAAAAHLPTMEDFVGRRAATGLLAAHGLATALAVGCPWAPDLAPAAGGALIADAGVLLAVLLGAATRYRRAAKHVAAALATG